VKEKTPKRIVRLVRHVSRVLQIVKRVREQRDIPKGVVIPMERPDADKSNERGDVAAVETPAGRDQRATFPPSLDTHWMTPRRLNSGNGSTSAMRIVDPRVSVRVLHASRADMAPQVVVEPRALQRDCDGAES